MRRGFEFNSGFELVQTAIYVRKRDHAFLATSGIAKIRRKGLNVDSNYRHMISTRAQKRPISVLRGPFESLSVRHTEIRYQLFLPVGVF